ncbi:MAG: hypothetical protein QM768_17040 [Agriterribacter sp.]
MSFKSAYCQVNAVTNGAFDTDLSGWTSSGGWSFSGGRARNSTDGNVTQTLSQYLNNVSVSSGKITIAFDYRSGNCSSCSAASSYAYFDVSFAGITYLTLAVPTGTDNVSTMLQNGASVNMSSFAQSTEVRIVLTIPWNGANPANGMLTFTHRPGGGRDDNNIDNVFVASHMTILPVKLEYFTGKYNDGYTSLMWQTTEEFNTKLFEIGYSKDGNTFQKEGEVLCNNKPGGGKYFFTSEASGFFRLKIIYKDGKIEYSKILNIVTNAESSAAASLVFPNPVTGTCVTLSIGIAKLRNTYASLYTTDGKSVGLFYIVSNKQVLDMANIPTGLLVLKLANGEIIKIVKK